MSEQLLALENMSSYGQCFLYSKPPPPKGEVLICSDIQGEKRSTWQLNSFHSYFRTVLGLQKYSKYRVFT